MFVDTGPIISVGTSKIIVSVNCKLFLMECNHKCWCCDPDTWTHDLIGCVGASELIFSLSCLT